MRKFIFQITICIIFSACGGNDDDSPTSEVTPSAPILITPTNGMLCIDNNVLFQWNSSIGHNDAISYQIQVAKDNQFSEIEHTLTTGSLTNQSISLGKGIAYYWRVKATSSKSKSSDYSSTYNFYTEGDAELNHLPFSPELVKPDLNLVVQTAATTLEWNANDVDTNDALIFDVYFGTVNQPITKIAENQTSKTLEVNVNSSTYYYWKVVVKDQNGGETIGQVWNFKTD